MTRTVDMNIAICEALDLDPHQVMALTIDLDHALGPVVVVTFKPSRVDGLVETLGRYVLTPAPDTKRHSDREDARETARWEADKERPRPC